MILASHGIFSAYGFWLPNDPRGSWSDFVRRWDLIAFGRPAKTDARHSLAHVEHNRNLRLSAKSALRFQPIRFTGIQARAIARGFAIAVQRSAYQILACSIMPNHVHVIVRRHAQSIETILSHLKSRATSQLVAEGLHPFTHLTGADKRFPSVWARRSWKVFLNSTSDIARAIEYVRNNPTKDGMKPQRWNFIQDP